MRRIATTITQRGQVTIPVEVQRLLGVGPRDKVVFAIDQDEVRLVPARFTLESTLGSLAPPTRSEDLARLADEVKDEHAEEVVTQMSRE